MGNLFIHIYGYNNEHVIVYKVECGQPRHRFQKSPFWSVYTRDAPMVSGPVLSSYSYSLKCPDTKHRYHTACDKCHIQTKKHRQQNNRQQNGVIRD